MDDGEESGLLYYNARYYDPMIGRFISADTMIPDPSFSQGFNRYMYVAGNPVNFNDPSGHIGLKGIWHKITKSTVGKWIEKRCDKAGDWWKDKGKDIADGYNNATLKDWWKAAWHDNQWLRVTVYTVIIIAAVVSVIFCPPLANVYLAIGFTEGT